MSRRDVGSRERNNYRADRHDAGRTVRYPLHTPFLRSERTNEDSPRGGRRMRSASPSRSDRARLRDDYGPRDPSPRRLHSRSPPLRGPRHGSDGYGFRGRSTDGFRRPSLEPHSVGDPSRDRRIRSPPPVARRGSPPRGAMRASPPLARQQSSRAALRPLTPRYSMRPASPQGRGLRTSPRSSHCPVSPKLAMRPLSPQLPLRPPRMPSPPLTSAFDREHDRHTHEAILGSRSGTNFTLQNPPPLGTAGTNVLDKQEDETLSSSGMLVSRSIFMNDGTVGTFYALPPDPMSNPLQATVDNSLRGQVLPSFSDGFSQYTTEPATLSYSGLDKFVPTERDFLASQDQRLSQRTLLGQSQYVASDRNLLDYPPYTRDRPLSSHQNTFDHPLQRRGSRSPLRAGGVSMSLSNRAGYESELDRASRRIRYDKREPIFSTEISFREEFSSPHGRRVDQDYSRITEKDRIRYDGGEGNGQFRRLFDEHRLTPPRYSPPIYDLPRQRGLVRSPEPRGSSRFDLRSSGFPRQMRMPPRESSRHETGLPRHMNHRPALRSYPSPERFRRWSPRRIRSLTPPIMRKYSSYEEEKRAWKRKYIEMGGEPVVSHRSSHSFEPDLKRRERDTGNGPPQRNEFARNRRQTGWDQKDGWLDRREDLGGRSGYRPMRERISSPRFSSQQPESDRRNLGRNIMDNNDSSQQDKDGQDLPPDLPEESAEFKQQVQRCFLKHAKMINEDPDERKKYEEQGEAGTLLCVACGRLSKTFVDTHSLVMHTLQSQKKGLRAEHLGLCKAICTTMGWSHSKEPANGKDYQDCSAEESKANREDLILWPPAVIVHYIGKKNGGDEFIAEALVKDLLRDIGLVSEREKIALGKGDTVVVKYSPLLTCLKDAQSLHNHFASKNLGRDSWSLVKSAKCNSDVDAEDDECLEKRLLYGYLALAQDLDKVDADLQRRCQVKSRKDIEAIVGDPLAANNAED